MQLGSKVPLKAADLQPINEEGPDGTPLGGQIYMDPEDPKKKRYDELKKKALLLANKKTKRRQAGEEVSDTTSIKSVTSKVSESQMSMGSVSAGTTSSVAGPFLTHARAPRSEALPSMRAVTPRKTQSDGLSSFKAEFAALAGKHIGERSYSPVFHPRGLNDEDNDEEYEERIAEMALEMDMAMAFMGEVGTFLHEKEDIQLLQCQEKIVEKAFDDHMEMVDQLYS